MVLKNLFTDNNGEIDIENRPMDMGRGEERVRCMERVTWKLTFSSVQFSSVAESCPTLCDPIDGSPSGSSVPGILQARMLEWVAISFSEFVGLQKRKMTTFSIEMDYFKRTQRFLLYCLSGMRTTLFSQAPVCFIFSFYKLFLKKIKCI